MNTRRPVIKLLLHSRSKFREEEEISTVCQRENEQLRQDQSAEDKEKRLQRRYQKPKYKGTSVMKRALAACYQCGERTDNIRKRPQMLNNRRNRSRCSQCSQLDHNVLSCKATLPLDTVPVVLIELTVEPTKQLGFQESVQKMQFKMQQNLQRLWDAYMRPC
jgi:hypothetical protein